MAALLSVIIPCYNNGGYLSEMLDCCIRQTFKDWEVIVVDDGSTDDTPLKIEKYTENDSRIHLYRRERQPKGSVVCRNIGFEKSTGKYIIHFDADDLISDSCFEKRVAFMESHPDCDYASFPAMGFSDNTKLPQYNDKGMKWGVGEDGEDLLKRFFSFDYPFSVWNNIYRREAVTDYPWDEKVKIYTDISYIIPIILAGKKHLYSQQKELDYFYRQGGGNVNNMCSSFVSKEKCESTLYFFRKTLDELKKRTDGDLRVGQFKGLIITHFERLVAGNNKDDIVTFINLCKEYYDDKFVSKLEKIRKKSEKVNFAEYKIRLYYTFWRTFGHPRHGTLLLMNIKKKILH